MDTRNWWPGKRTLVLPKAFRQVSWHERAVTADLTRDRIRSAPEHDPARTVDRAYEEQFHAYYGYAGYRVRGPPAQQKETATWDFWSS
ncbi:hypothetical protein [Aquibium microcysteis]|uniref:hypothetical protein n=1 Tax=Aquibium microcysteis TaxID=675281 RepID=UPI00165CFAD2|nr:hypothetical protein [Aquibium microcysteis]